MVAWAITLAAACLLLVACGGGQARRTASATPPSEYVQAVQALLQPAGQLASRASDRLRGVAGAAGQAADPEDLVAAERGRIRDLAILSIPDAGLRRQRDAVVAAARRALPGMHALARALARPGRPAVLRAATPFFASLKALSSAGLSHR